MLSPPGMEFVTSLFGVGGVILYQCFSLGPLNL